MRLLGMAGTAVLAVLLTACSQAAAQQIAGEYIDYMNICNFAEFGARAQAQRNCERYELSACSERVIGRALVKAVRWRCAECRSEFFDARLDEPPIRHDIWPTALETPEVQRSWYAACNLRRGAGHAFASQWFGSNRCSRADANQDRQAHIDANQGSHGGSTVVLGSASSCE